jgi:hypothetical protein
MSQKSFFIILAFLFTFDSAYCWEKGKTEIFPLDCKSLIMNGADHLHLEITAESGSYGVPYLVGSKDGKQIWKKRSPANEVNLAKFAYTCKGNTITVSDAYPGVYAYQDQTLVWNGKFIEKRVKFSKGSDHWSVAKKTSVGQSDRFRLWANKGQTIKVEMSSVQATSIFQIYEPGSKVPMQNNIFGREMPIWSTVLNKTGDYVIEIDGTADNTLYDVKLWIN